MITISQKLAGVLEEVGLLKKRKGKYKIEIPVQVTKREREDQNSKKFHNFILYEEKGKVKNGK